MFELSHEDVMKILPVIGAALIAVLGWITTYFHKWYFDKKSNRLDRVNKQLRELYGPLYAILMASDATWEAFWKNHRPSHGQNSYFGKNLNVTDSEKETWRNWMENVFEPFNAETEKLILKNIDLLESDQIPKSFISALAHIAAYKAVLYNWHQSDFSNHISVNNWPSRELLATVKPEYEKLRALQRKLLGM